MSVMVTELYKALKESGASEEAAIKAAEAEVSEAKFREKLGELATMKDLHIEIGAVKAEISALKAEIFRAMLIQTGVTIGAIVALVKILG